MSSTTVTLDNVAPISLNVQNTAVGPRVFYGTGSTPIDDLNDVFPETTTLSVVTVGVQNDAGIAIDVQFDSETPLPVGVRGWTSQTMEMPSAGACTIMHITVWSQGTKHHDPIIRLKRKINNVVPTCSE